MAVGWLQETDGDEGGNIHANASDHINQAMKANGYAYDGSHGYLRWSTTPTSAFVSRNSAVST